MTAVLTVRTGPPFRGSAIPGVRVRVRVTVRVNPSGPPEWRPSGMVDRNPDSDDELNMNCMYVCLGFNDTFSTNRLYRTITVG